MLPLAGDILGDLIVGFIHALFMNVSNVITGDVVVDNGGGSISPDSDNGGGWGGTLDDGGSISPDNDSGGGIRDSDNGIGGGGEMLEDESSDN